MVPTSTESNQRSETAVLMDVESTEHAHPLLVSETWIVSSANPRSKLPFNHPAFIHPPSDTETKNRPRRDSLHVGERDTENTSKLPHSSGRARVFVGHYGLLRERRGDPAGTRETNGHKQRPS